MIHTKRLLFFLFAVLGCSTIALLSCEKENMAKTDNLSSRNIEYSGRNQSTDPLVKGGTVCGEVDHRWIIDAEGNHVGKAQIYNDEEFFYVRLMGLPGYKFKSAHMHLESLKSQIPLTANGCPDVESFKYLIKSIEEQEKIRFKVPVYHIKKNILVTVAADVVNSKTDAQPKVMRVWVEGKEYGCSFSGRVFQFVRGICEEKSADSESTLFRNEKKKSKSEPNSNDIKENRMSSDEAKMSE